MKFYFALLLFINTYLASAEDECLFYKFCGSSARSSTHSLPSNATSGNLNPSDLSTIKGYGIETTFEENNPLTFDFVSGNGNIGALVSPTIENSFFSNRSIEIDDVALLRHLNKTQYKNNKLSLAVGFKLIDKKTVSLEMGVSAKRNPDIGKINPGFGLTFRLYLFHFGAYLYQDDVKIDLANYLNPYTAIPYSTTYKSPTYQEHFKVETYSGGLQIKNLFFDIGLIKTKYNFYTENTQIYLYSMAFSYQNFFFNLAKRIEYSPNLDYAQGTMMIKRKKEVYYSAVQYQVNRYLIIGIQRNNFLLDEWSGIVTLFY